MIFWQLTGHWFHVVVEIIWRTDFQTVSTSEQLAKSCSERRRPKKPRAASLVNGFRAASCNKLGDFGASTEEFSVSCSYSPFEASARYSLWSLVFFLVLKSYLFMLLLTSWARTIGMTHRRLQSEDWAKNNVGKRTQMRLGEIKRKDKKIRPPSPLHPHPP